MEATAGIPIGSSASKSVCVSRDLTVAHFHGDMPEVYGTPMMIYLMEVAAAEAIEQYLPPGMDVSGSGDLWSTSSWAQRCMLTREQEVRETHANHRHPLRRARCTAGG